MVSSGAPTRKENNMHDRRLLLPIAPSVRVAPADVSHSLVGNRVVQHVTENDRVVRYN
jgi:hypothetical protein